jgi:hypothetical protein
LLEAALEGIFQEVVAGVFFGARMWAEFGGWEEELPGPFAWGDWVFAGEGFGHVDLADAGDEVLAVFFAEGGEVGLEAWFEVQGEFRVAEDVAEEEDEGVERLFLCRGRNLSFEGEELDVGGDGGRADLGGRLADAAEAESGEPNGPVTVCLFCSESQGKPAAQGRARHSTARIRTACKPWRNCQSAMPVERPRVWKKSRLRSAEAGPSALVQSVAQRWRD